jgi:hypothetical protein
MTQPRFRTATAAALLTLVSTSARAQEDAEVLDENESEVATEDDSSDDGGWSDEDYEDEGGGGDSQIHFGLRTGWGIPLGKSDGGPDSDFSDGIIGQIPIWLDLGWQATPRFMVGMYFSYGFVLLEDDVCPDGSDCIVRDFWVGAKFDF